MYFSNNFDKSVKSVISEYLSWATHVDFAVAFIRRSGLFLIENQLKEVINKNGIIRVLAGQDFGYTESEALSSLVDIGAEVKVFDGKQIFHPKYYAFKNDTQAAILIGSSNLTSSGLEMGIEWNISLDNPAIVTQANESFNRIWNSDNAKEVSADLLQHLSEDQSKIIVDPKQNAIIERLDSIARSFQFGFMINQSFLYQSNHPLTIPQRYNSFFVDRFVKKGESIDVRIYLNNKYVTGNIYHGISSYGKYYQLRIDRFNFSQLESKFELDQHLKVKLKFYDSLIQVYLLS